MVLAPPAIAARDSLTSLRPLALRIEAAGSVVTAGASTGGDRPNDTWTA